MPSILFLCSGNYYRSRFAEAYFNHHASRRGLAWRAESRGFRLHAANVGPLSVHTIRRLRELEIAPADETRFPLVAGPADLDAATRIIAVKRAEHEPLATQHFPDRLHRFEFWDIHDIDCAEPTEALPKLQRKLDALLDELAAAQ